MPYCTLQNLIDRFGEAELLSLTDINDDGIVDATVINVSIDDASVLIDSYIPLDTDKVLNAQNLTRVCADIARYYLYDNDVLDVVEQRYKDAIKWLEMVSKGVILLAKDAATIDEDASVEFKSDKRVF